MAYPLDLVDAPIPCHAWNKDGTLLAFCPNTSDVLIYKVNGKQAEEAYKLTDHTQVVSCIDWNFVTNQIVTCSHDRNAYVWTLNEAENKWKPELVVLKLQRAATYCRWSPDGKRFVVATGTSKFRLCAFNKEQNWWQSFSYDNKKPTSLCVEFMPDGKHIICSGTDRHCRYFSIDEMETKKILRARAANNPDGKKKKTDKNFNVALYEWSAQGWNNSCAVSPNGEWIAYTTQDSFIKFIHKDQIEEDNGGQAMNLTGLPLISITFISDKALVGAGFDCVPRLFYLDGGNWTDLGYIDIPEIREQAGTGGGGNSLQARAAAFGGKQVQKSANLHSNIVLGIRLLPNAFSTCSNDGRIGVWPFDSLKKHFADKSLF